MTLQVVILLTGFILSWNGNVTGQTGFIVVPVETAAGHPTPLASVRGYYAYGGPNKQVALGNEWRGECFQAWAFSGSRGAFAPSNTVCVPPMSVRPSAPLLSLFQDVHQQ